MKNNFVPSSSPSSFRACKPVHCTAVNKPRLRLFYTYKAIEKVSLHSSGSPGLRPAINTTLCRWLRGVHTGTVRGELMYGTYSLQCIVT